MNQKRKKTAIAVISALDYGDRRGRNGETKSFTSPRLRRFRRAIAASRSTPKISRKPSSSTPVHTKIERKKRRRRGSRRDKETEIKKKIGPLGGVFPMLLLTFRAENTMNRHLRPPVHTKIGGREEEEEISSKREKERAAV